MFYKGISKPCLFKSLMELGKLFLIPGANLEHVCLFLHGEDEDLMYHVGKRGEVGWRKSRWMHRRFLPDKSVFLGVTEISREWLDSCPPVKFNFIKILLWYFVTRWFSKWMPKDNCTIVTCQLLREIGYPVNDQVVPTLLWKEISNANDTNSWASWSREEHVSKANS